MRVYQEDAVDVLKQCISDESLQKILIFFPDPWPKKRHHKRRLIQPAFIELLQQKLILSGEIYCATDWEDYAYHILEMFHQNKHFKNQSKEGIFIVCPDWRPLTKFEARGKRLGHSVWDMSFQKIPPASLVRRGGF